MLWACRDRILDLKNDRRFRYILLFKNHGEPAGASLEHTHSQLIALPIVPTRVREEVDSSKRYYDEKERCIFCDLIRQEVEAGERVILGNDYFIALAPYAPRFPFEAWILPRSTVPLSKICRAPITEAWRKCCANFYSGSISPFPVLLIILSSTLRLSLKRSMTITTGTSR